MQQIVKKYGLELDGAWNKELLPHRGRHPEAYHRFVYDQMKRADSKAHGSAARFVALFERYVKDPVRANPDLLRRIGWVE